MKSQRDDNLDAVDRLPAEWRLLVHEVSYPIVKAFMDAGIRSPKVIRHLVLECWRGPRGSTNGGKPKGFAGAQNLAMLDWFLIQAGANISGATLVRSLRATGLVIVPIEPSKAMVEASEETVTFHDKIRTKTEKHRLRIRAANTAGAEHYWPFLAKPKSERDAA